jgi:hypothetical protein
MKRSTSPDHQVLKLLFSTIAFEFMVDRRTPVLILFLALFFGTACEYTPPRAEKRIEIQWKEVGTWSGHGNQQLETFPIEHFTWRVRWETNNESPAGAGRFHVTANSGDSGRTLAEVADVKGVASDVTYITELPHRYYFVVTSTGVDWTLTAEEAIQ